MNYHPSDIQRLWDDTKRDLEAFLSLLDVDLMTGPSTSIALLLVCLMDVWGAVMNDQLGNPGATAENIGRILTLLQEKHADRYLFKPADKTELTDALRNNLTHSFGLRILGTGKLEDWPNIDVSSEGPCIYKDNLPNLFPGTDTYRWHVNSYLASKDFLEIVGDWVESQGLNR